MSNNQKELQYVLQGCELYDTCKSFSHSMLDFIVLSVYAYMLTWIKTVGGLNIRFITYHSMEVPDIKYCVSFKRMTVHIHSSHISISSYVCPLSNGRCVQ